MRPIGDRGQGGAKSLLTRPSPFIPIILWTPPPPGGGWEDAQNYPCGNADESRTHTVGERKLYKEERNLLEEMRKIDGYGMEKFGTFVTREKTTAVLGK